MIGSFLLGLAVLPAAAPPAHADTPGCSLQDHCYSVIRAGGPDATLRAGAYGTWNRAAMGANCNNTDHRWINSTMWFWPLSGNGWVESGHTAGWLNAGGSCDYYAYAAWQREDGSGYSERMFARLNHNDGVTDEFQISRAGTTNVYNVFWNGQRVTTANVQFWNSRRIQMGGEAATGGGTSNTFNMTGRALAADGSRVLMPNPQTPFVEDPPLYGNSPGNSAWTWRVR